MTTVAFIFARGGSSMQKKNLRSLAGRSLLARAIEVGTAVKAIDSIIVSTDDEEIATEARAAGADVPFRRPAALATATAPEWAAWRHAIGWFSERYGADALRRFVSLPTTAPLRTAVDVEKCLATFDEGKWDAVVTVRPAERNPYFNLIVLDKAGRARLMNEPAGAVHRRQEAPEIYDMTTVAYVASPDFVLRADSLFAGRIGAVLIPKQRAVDVDDEWDLLTAEAYLRHSQGH